MVLLFILYLSGLTGSGISITPMPSMETCLAAAVALESEHLKAKIKCLRID